MTLSRPDFDFSKYVGVPDAWIENALDIPNTVKDRPKVLPIRRYISAASIVLVVVLGITAYFLFGNKSPLHVAENQLSIATESASEHTATSTAATESSAVQSTDATVNRQTATSSQTLPTTPSTQNTTDSSGRTIITPTTPTDNVPPAPPSVTASETTEQQQSFFTNKPDPTPTQKPSSPTAAPAPTSAPATQPPATPTVDPGYDAPTELPWIIENPSEPGYGDQDALVLKAELPDRIRLNEKYVYCRIHQSTGELIGDKDLYAWRHRVTVNRNYKVVTYKPSEYGLRLAPGNYVYYFYESNGDVFADGSFTIN